MVKREREGVIGRRKVLATALAGLVGTACSAQAGVPGAMWTWNYAFPPYQVIDNVHYVGTSEIAQFLITTPEGHLLLDSGFEASVPRLRDDIGALGFRFQDIKLLLSSHAHIDHVQAHSLVRRLTGATVVCSQRDGLVLEGGGKGDPEYEGTYSWPPCPVDRVVSDGDEVALGGTTLTARLTPGHTMGAITWTMRLKPAPTEPGRARPLDLVFFPSANINPGVRLRGNARYPSIAADFERSFAIWKSLPCDVFLGAHGSFFGMREKRRRQRAGERPNPFIDPEGYRRFVANAEQRYREELASEV
jgi:metallo-beta-lactamase class B